MQHLELELNHFNFYCPATGIFILKDGEQCNESAPSLMAYWVDEVIDEPFIKNPELAAAWAEYCREHIQADNEELGAVEMLQNFLAEYPQNNWVVFKITHCSVAHGHQSITAWFVIDMEAKAA